VKILAISSAEKECSIALLDNNSPVCEELWATKQTHSKRIMDMVARVMDQSGFQLDEIDRFIAAQGPGSFTGLRIGISTVKGLAYATGKPCSGVSSLDGIAWQFSYSSVPVCVMMDAQRGEVYHAVYQFKNGKLLDKSEEKAEMPVKALASIKGDALFAGSGTVAYREVIKSELGEAALFVPLFQNTIKASALAQAFSQDPSAFKQDNVLNPVYLRKSDAEVNKIRH